VASYTWKPIAPAPVRIGDGVLLPFGNALYLTTGLVQAPGKRKRTHNRQTYKYDIAKDQWIEPDVANYPVGLHATAAIAILPQ